MLRMNTSVLVPNMGSDPQLKRSDYDVMYKYKKKKDGMKHQKAQDIQL